MKSEELAYLFLAVVSEIPVGKVCTYGKIARKSGYPNQARLVGKILGDSEYYGSYPCHRVVHSDGGLVGGWQEQRLLLLTEGVYFLPNGRVDMKRSCWE